MLKLFLSSILAAAIWLTFPLTLDLSESKRTPEGWRSYWQDFPTYLADRFCRYSLVALVVQAIFLRRILSARGIRFWLLPLILLPVAASFLLFISFIWDGVVQHQWQLQPINVPIFNFFYVWAATLYIVVAALVWLTYPLTIITLFATRQIYAARHQSA